MYKVQRKQERLTKDLMNVNKIKEQMPEAVDEENKRINVDSSKKRAVMQHMDYDGFHQMVLGANLKTVKDGAVMNIHNQSDPLDTSALNAVAKLHKTVTEGYDEKIVKAKVAKKQVGLPKNQTELLRDVLLRSEGKEVEALTALPIEHVRALFVTEVQTDLFLNIVRGINKEDSLPESQTGWLREWIECVTEASDFSFIVDFFTDEEKVEIKQALEKIGASDKIEAFEIEE